jgi:hypothetical protein
MSGPGEKDTFPRDAEEARLDAELTRQELGETVNALAHKVNVPERTKERAVRMGTAARQRMPEPVVHGAERAVRTIRRHPLPAAGAAVGLVIAARLIARRGA